MPLWAAGSPFGTNDELRARGYRWMPRGTNGIDRACWTDVAPVLLDAELEWRRVNVYAGVVPQIPQRRVTAYDPGPNSCLTLPNKTNASSIEFVISRTWASSLWSSGRSHSRDCARMSRII